MSDSTNSLPAKADSNAPADPKKGRAWCHTGYENIPEPPASDSWRFYVKLNAENAEMVVLLTDEPVCLYEHQLEMDGKFDNYFTCIADMDPEVPCPLCVLPSVFKSGHQRNFIGVFSMIHKTTIKKDGKVTAENPLRLLVVKAAQLKLFKQWKKDFKCLVGSEWSVRRTNDKAPGIGDNWQRMTGCPTHDEEGNPYTYEQMRDKGLARALKMFGKDAKPHDLYEVFAPKSADELNKVLAKYRGASSAKETVKKPEEPDDIPF